MSQMKYIVSTVSGYPEPYVFSETVAHQEMAQRVGADTTDIVGAGFCGLRENLFCCWGESVSLKVKSRGDIDSQVLNRRFGLVDLY